MHSFKRHKFNIFPEAGAEDFARLVDDMRANGYDAAMPITLYQGAILDGWNRYRAASELGLTPATTEFDGTDSDALDYTLRTNKRRNLTSSQWAAVAVEADELIAAIRAAVEAQRRAKQAATQAESVSQLIDEQPDYNASRSDHKAAEASPASGVTTCCGCGRTRGGFAFCRSRCFAVSSLTTGVLGAMNTRRAGNSRRVLVAAITANVYSSHVGSFGPRFIASLAAT